MVQDRYLRCILRSKKDAANCRVDTSGTVLSTGPVTNFAAAARPRDGAITSSEPIEKRSQSVIGSTSRGISIGEAVAGRTNAWRPTAGAPL